ncbi:hypothetical protein BUALT_Bualt15G0137100 [Buddleja alternifolia]|uniref:NAC domain-containing protein n=1 Tax=Buddleja alternifolia TaxID=168488 RepID=A0AAV6WMQ4_9LAMI|nr:hypothetical protein BUALT_Bualt15G0137100 [Buddleja alternifolia]
MLGMEEILCELEREEMNEQGLPPGFRFHPTDEELITFYLASKVFNGTFCGVQIAEVDLNRCEPWELPEVAKMGEREWYFFSLRDRKYPTGLRTNRATGAGYWKATGKDREVYSTNNSYSSSGAAEAVLLGMKKTLVFYKGRAPRGEKTKWVMHEYRLDGHFSSRHTCKEEWVICRIFHKIGEKKIPGILQGQSYLMSTTLPPLLEPPTLLNNLESQSPHQLIQNPNPNFDINIMTMTQQSDDLKTLINPLVSMQSDLFSSSSLNNFQANPISSFNDHDATFKPFLSNQHYLTTFKELNNVITNAKQCKKESASDSEHGHFDHHLISDRHGFVNNNNNNNNMQWVDEERINQEKYSCTKYDDQINPLLMLSGLDCDMGNNIPSALGDAGVGNNNNNHLTAAAIDHLMSTEPAYTWW